MASKVWDGLSSEQQKIVQKVSFEASYRDRDQVIAAGKEAVGKLKSKGVKFHDFPKAEAKKWKAANPDFFGDFVKAQTAAGRGDDAKKTIKIWREVVKD